ncbi:tetratricopeptide repeat domain containing protein [Cardiosporidium cionae]|uniref:Tetratricopeptide repeat domain containing protein n=1 Tax=Cardiosporidium cionae TaxID=476202 RepID=A0ABQ7JAL2_9APIC|nr:tetratricopeptide repeat domain containing protein [Cardiosporidium cionae]|eukprot:KAF8821036.1 tetratricopeptide repeat domain containing protein [Cardiosporidium cionae]
MSNKELAQQEKQKGNAAFEAKQFQTAVDHFTAAIAADNTDHVLYSNRSAAYASIPDYSLALKDADECIRLQPNWAKVRSKSSIILLGNMILCLFGYSRKGVAEFHLGNKVAAREAFLAGLKIDPKNSMLLEGLKLVQNSENAKRDETYIVQAMQLLANNPKFNSYLTDQDFVRMLQTVLKEMDENPNSLQKWLSHPDKRLREVLFSYLGINIGENGPFSSPTNASPNKEEPEPTVETVLLPHEKEAIAYKEQGNLLYKKRCFDEALEAYDNASRTNPKEIMFYYNKAAIYLERKEYDLCLKICEEAISKRYEMSADFTKVAKIFIRMATCYERMEDYDNAIAMYEKSLMEDNNRRTRTALKAIERKKELKIKEDYLNPELAEKVKASSHSVVRSFRWIVVSVLSLLSAFLSTLIALLIFSIVKLRMNFLRMLTTLPQKKHSIFFAPNNRFLCCYCFLEYDEAIKRNPKDVRLYSNRAAALMKLLEFPSALKDCDAALELDPKFVKAWSRKGTILMHLKDYNKAMQAFDSGLAVNPDSNECKTGKFQLLMKIKESSNSDEMDETRVKRALEDPEIKEILADPQFNLILKNISENAASASEYCKDPKIAAGLQKLVAAGNTSHYVNLLIYMFLIL